MGEGKESKLRKEEKATYETSGSTQRARMHTMQNTMPDPIQLGTPLLRMRPPRQKNHPSRPIPRNNINHLLRKLLPPLFRMRFRFMRLHRQTSIQQQHPAIGPGGEETTVARRRAESVRVFLFEEFVDVLEGGWSWGGGSDGEAETVGLVDVVVWILA